MIPKILKPSFLLLLMFSIFACNSDPLGKPEPFSVNFRSVKYEITGNYTGQLNIIYNDNMSGNTVVAVTTLPWSKSIEYPSNVQGIGIAGNTILGQQGVAGQTATLKIFAGGTVVRTTTAIADNNGAINFQPLAYVFP